MLLKLVLLWKPILRHRYLQPFYQSIPSTIHFLLLTRFQWFPHIESFQHRYIIWFPLHYPIAQSAWAHIMAVFWNVYKSLERCKSWAHTQPLLLRSIFIAASIVECCVHTWVKSIVQHVVSWVAQPKTLLCCEMWLRNCSHMLRNFGCVRNKITSWAAVVLSTQMLCVLFSIVLYNRILRYVCWWYWSSGCCLLINCLARKAKKKNALKKRTCSVREWIRKREARGLVDNLVKELRDEDGCMYKNFMRMAVPDFDYLLEKVTPLIKKQATFMRKSIRQVIAWRWLWDI